MAYDALSASDLAAMPVQQSAATYFAGPAFRAGLQMLYVAVALGDGASFSRSENCESLLCFSAGCVSRLPCASQAASGSPPLELAVTIGFCRNKADL